MHRWGGGSNIRCNPNLSACRDAEVQVPPASADRATYGNVDSVSHAVSVDTVIVCSVTRYDSYWEMPLLPACGVLLRCTPPSLVARGVGSLDAALHVALRHIYPPIAYRGRIWPSLQHDLAALPLCKGGLVVGCFTSAGCSPMRFERALCNLGGFETGSYGNGRCSLTRGCR